MEKKIWLIDIVDNMEAETRFFLKSKKIAPILHEFNSRILHGKNANLFMNINS